MTTLYKIEPMDFIPNVPVGKVQAPGGCKRALAPTRL